MYGYIYDGTKVINQCHYIGPAAVGRDSESATPPYARYNSGHMKLAHNDNLLIV